MILSSTNLPFRVHRLTAAPNTLRPVDLPHKDLVELAAATTALLAIPLAILTFFAERVITRRSRKESLAGYEAGLLVAALYTGACDSIAWWAWLEAIPSETNLFLGLSRGVCFAAVFAPPAAFALVGVIVGVVGLIRLGWDRLWRTSP